SSDASPSGAQTSHSTARSSPSPPWCQKLRHSFALRGLTGSACRKVTAGLGLSLRDIRRVVAEQVAEAGSERVRASVRDSSETAWRLADQHRITEGVEAVALGDREPVQLARLLD